MDHKRIFFSVTVEIRYIGEYDTQSFETKYIIYTKTKQKQEEKKQEEKTNKLKKPIILI